MAQHAFDKEGFLSAFEAEIGGRYWCLECKAPVKLRKGKYAPHFYHLRTSPGCRLYSKSEDHLLLQLQLQKFLPLGEAEIEKPFSEIHRVADVYWSREHLIFEIQCSSLELGEAQYRVANYREIGCEVIWLLDDRIFNRRHIRPVESWVRAHGAYYVSFDRNQPFSLYYDQFEIATDFKRLKKGIPLRLDLKTPHKLPQIEWPSNLPSCVKVRIAQSSRYFRGDLVDRAARAFLYSNYAFAISRWYSIEKELTRELSFPSRVKQFFQDYIIEPYGRLILFLIEKVENPDFL